MSTPLQGGDDKAVTTQQVSTQVTAGGFNIPLDGFFDRGSARERRALLYVAGAVLVAGVLAYVMKGRA